MRNSSHVRESLVDLDVGGQIRGRAQFALDDASAHVSNNDILCGHRVIGNATRLDGDQAPVASDAAGVTKSVEHQAAADELKIRIQHLLAQDLQLHRFDTFWPWGTRLDVNSKRILINASTLTWPPAAWFDGS